MTKFFALVGALAMIGGTVAALVMWSAKPVWAVGIGLVVFVLAVDAAANAPDRDWR